MKYFYFVGFLPFFLNSSFGQVTFQKTYGDDAVFSAMANSVYQTADGGYIVCGERDYFQAHSSDIYLIKTDVNGDTLWTKAYGNNIRIYKGNCVKQTSDGGYIITGQANYDGGSNCCAEIYLMRTDVNGDTLWTKSFSPQVVSYNANIEGNSVSQTSDGGYIIVGSFGDSSAVFLIKTDINGDTLWAKSYGGYLGKSVQQTSDGGYIVLGTGLYSMFLIKTDNQGDTLWSRTYGEDSIIFNGNYVQQTFDGGYELFGLWDHMANSSMIVIKTDVNGDTVWCKVYGDSYTRRCYYAQQTQDSGFIVLSAMGVGLNSDGIYLVKITASGNVIWSKTYRNTSSHANAVQQTADGGFLIAGVTDDNADNGNLYLVKTDANGNSGCYETNPFTNVVNPIIHINKPQTIASSRNINVHVLPIIRGSGTNVTTLCSSLGIEEFSGHNEINIYPNPSSNGIFQIRNTINGVIEKTEVSNYLGQIIFSKKGNIEEINLSNFSHGIYFYSVNKGEGKIFNGKIIKQ